MISEHYWDNDNLCWRKKQTKLQCFFRSITPSWWRDLWWEYVSLDDIYGPGHRSSKKFKIANLALVIATITLILAIIIAWKTLT